MKNAISFILTGVLIIFNSCSKNDYPTPPKVEILSPKKGVTYPIGKSIPILATIESDIGIRAVKVGFENPVGYTLYVIPYFEILEFENEHEITIEDFIIPYEQFFDKTSKMTMAVVDKRGHQFAYEVDYYLE